jgi:DNA-binding SARP family transcriptional activator
MEGAASRMADRPEFRILGPLEALVGGVAVALGGRRQRAVLAILLSRPNEVVPADRLIDDVWGDDPPETAANVLQGYVSHLRRALGRDVIATRGRDYAIRLADGALDLHRFERLTASAAAARAQGRADAAVDDLRAALALWRGPALSDLAGLPSVARIAARLDELRNGALERRLEADIACGREADALVELRALVAEHPLRERLRALQMLALYRDARQAEALEAYRAARATLVDELGIEPGRELQDLERAILEHDPALGPGERRSALGRRDDRPAPAVVVAAALAPEALEAVAAIAEPLGHTPGRELVVVSAAGDAKELPALTQRLAALRTDMAGRGAAARVAAFASQAAGADLARLAAEQEASLVLVDAPVGRLDDDELMVLLDAAPCDVGVVVAGGAIGAGPVLVPFSGAEHDWAAVELGAGLARAAGRPLRLAGASVGSSGRDASRLLASASLAIQRMLGIHAEPVIVDPAPDALLEIARDAGIVVVGLSERWRREGLGRAREALATSPPCPVLLVRRGLRPGAFAPGESATRFTWTIAA